jgi:riboflavin transporter FmnP
MLFGAAALALGYFLSSVAYVRAYETLRANRQRAIRSCVAAHVALAAALWVLAAYGALPRWWWAAFVPVIARTVWGLAVPPGNVRQVGLREAWVAGTFTLIACLALK